MKDFTANLMPDGKIVFNQAEYEQVFKEAGLDEPEWSPEFPALVCLCGEGFCMMEKSEIEQLAKEIVQ